MIFHDSRNLSLGTRDVISFVGIVEVEFLQQMAVYAFPYLTSYWYATMIFDPFESTIESSSNVCSSFEIVFSLKFFHCVRSPEFFPKLHLNSDSVPNICF